MNVWEAMQQELTNFYQFLYHVTPTVIFQVKSWSDSTLSCLVHCDLVSTLFKKQSSLLSGNNTAFSKLSANSVDS